MTDKKYTVTCVHCDMLNYIYGGIKENSTIFDKAYCREKKEIRYGNNCICEKFKLRSGMFTTKNYPK